MSHIERIQNSLKTEISEDKAWQTRAVYPNAFHFGYYTFCNSYSERKNLIFIQVLE